MTGCGGDGAASERLTREEYAAELRSLVQRSTPATGLFFELVSGEALSPEACAEKADAFHEELEGLLGAAEKLRPPAEVAQVQAEFLGAARESVAAVGRAADDVGEGRLRCGTALNRRIYDLPSTRRAEQAVEQFEARGYLVLGD